MEAEVDSLTGNQSQYGSGAGREGTLGWFTGSVEMVESALVLTDIFILQ